MCSYNDYGAKADNHTLIQAENERKKDHKFLNHLILRDKSKKVDRIKFNFLLDGIPIMAYGLMNLAKSDIEEVVVIGNRDTEKILNEFIKTYNTNKDYERFKFAHEGEELSLSNTIKKGKEKLNLEKNELTLLLPGDIPFCFNLNPIIQDKDIPHYDGILNLNTRERVGRYFPRNYHLRVKKLGIKYYVKEPNVYLFNLNKLDLNLLDVFFGGRKTYSEFKEDSNSKEKGRSYLIKERFIKDGKWKHTLRALGKSSLFITPRIIPKLTEKIISKAENTKIYASLKKINSTINKRIYKLTDKPPVMTLKNLESLAKIGIGMNLKVKLTNHDPSTLEDIDSLEDWSYLNSMILELKDHPRGPVIIYPYYKEIQQFKEQAMPTLNKKVELYKNYPKYMNSLFEQFGLSPTKEKPYYKNKESFVVKSPYQDGKLDIKFSKRFVKNMVDNNILYHMRYVRTAKRD